MTAWPQRKGRAYSIPVSGPRWSFAELARRLRPQCKRRGPRVCYPCSDL